VNSKQNTSIANKRPNFLTSDKMVVNILISTAIGMAIIAAAVGIGGDNPLTVWILITAIIIDIGGIILATRGITLPGRVLVPAILTVATGFIAFTRGGLYHISVSGFPVIIVLAGLLLGIRGSFVFAAFASVAAGIIGYADINGISPFSELSRTGYDDIAVATTLFIVTAIVLRVIIVRLTESIQEAESFGQAQETTNVELKNLQGELEQRVAQRTAELEQRAAQLQTVSSVARTIASVQDLDTLLPDITKLVSEQFGYYHAGIFLVDDANEFAVLRAANSEGGKRMLDRHHKLRLDATSIVGYSISHGEHRIALDVGDDSVYFNNPDLPETRSEIALPLRVSGRVIGALDVQSKEPNAFTQEDINVASTLVDQVAIAIENARLFSESKKSLLESQSTFDKYVKQEWSSYARQARQTGFVYDGKQTIPLDENKQREQIKSITQTGRLSPEKTSSSIAVPIKLRGQTIGMLDVRSQKGQREWTQDEITLLEAAAERAALGLETARLVESAQRRASRERTIGDISSKIGAVSDLETIMQTAVEELGRRIGGSAEVVIELDTNDEQTGTPQRDQ
jgi:GAF domain-containing protein